jgi:site-specific DNA-cytosine methylase
LRTYTAFFPFSGLGLGARGFLDAQIHMMGEPASFRSVGGIDIDPLGCADFEYLTDSPALCADISTLTVADLIAFAGADAPDVVFMSPPCKSFSGLLSKAASESPKYNAMSRLVVTWTNLMLDAWGASPPRLVLLENVPRIASRGAWLLKEVKALLRKAGYVFHAQNHDCGELGGLAQHRQRYLLVARHPKRCAPLLYQPPKKRVRACGEVLEKLPLPEDPAGGPMHKLPRLSWINWVRLALIPAGGDWRDLEGVLADGQARREVFRRHHVGRWDESTATVAGSGSNGIQNIADPRVKDAFPGAYGINGWAEPTGTIPGESAPSNGRFAVADPRIVPQAGNEGMHHGKYKVRSWDEAAGTVIGADRVGSGAQSVADPRVALGRNLGPHARDNIDHVLGWGDTSKTITGASKPSSDAPSVADPRVAPFGNVDRVTPWSSPVGTITHAPAPSSGAAAVADPRLDMLRVETAYDHGYGVLRWDESSSTVAGGSNVGQGAYSVAEIRMREAFRGSYGVLSWQEACGVITGNGRPSTGRFSVADPRRPPKDGYPVIIAADGTWHRPLTTLELWALQSGPIEVKGKPVALAGTSSSKWRERIGNAVPRYTATAIAEQMLTCLVAADTGGWSLSAGGAVWVVPTEAAYAS